MSVLIDLEAYSQEVQAFVTLASRFAEKASVAKLTKIIDEMKRNIDFGKSEWVWSTPKPISFQSSRTYDGPGRNDAEAHVDFSFDCVFTRDVSIPKKSKVWSIKRCATHIVVHKKGNALPVHFDYKNKGQWGAQMHFQVAEGLCNLPIPRMPSGFFLPTDCADMALAELHHEEWRKLQASLRGQRDVSVMRNAQENRARTFIEDVHQQWKKDRRFTRISMLQDYTSTVGALKDHNGRAAKQL